MKIALTSLFTLASLASFANGFNNAELESISRQAFVSLNLNCPIENETPVITNKALDNFMTQTVVDFEFAKATIIHGIDGVGIIKSEFECKALN